MFRFTRFNRALAVFLLLNLLVEIFAPAVALALTGGPESPEFSSFEPVSTTDMVDDFSGDFTYNIPVVNVPGPEGSGYALSLSYHSGVNPEEEASWVGYGWTLNPGAINRSKRGYADEFDGHPVTQYNKTRPSWTSSSSAMLGLEIKSLSSDKVEKMSEQKKVLAQAVKPDSSSDAGPMRFNLSKSVRFNNYRGFSKAFSFGASFSGVGLGMSMSGGVATFNPTIDPFAMFGNKIKKAADVEKGKKKLGNKIASVVMALKKMDLGKSSIKSKGSFFNYGGADFVGGPSGTFSLSSYRGVSMKKTMSLQLDFFTNLGIEVGHTGNFSIQFPRKRTEVAAYGYRNPYQKEVTGKFRKTGQGRGDIDSFHDFSGYDYMVEKGTNVNKRDRYLPIPFSTPDIFMVTGEKLGGSFKLCRQDVGHVYPFSVYNREGVRAFGLEGNVGWNNAGVGLEVNPGHQKIIMGDWDRVGRFASSGAAGADEFYPQRYQYGGADKAYFRFLNDKSGEVSYTSDDHEASASLESYLDRQIPGRREFYPGLTGFNFSSGNNDFEKASSSSYIKEVSYADYSNGNALEESSVRNFFSSDEPDMRLNNSVAQFSIKDGSGNSKIFGLPVYTKDELSLSLMEVNKDNAEIEDNYLAYPHEPLKVVDHWKGKDHVLENDFVTGQYTPWPVAGTFLLTEIHTPNYVDVNNNKKADEGDFGGWTRFNYRQWERGNDDESNWYRYRAPYNGLFYNKGSLINRYDDAANVNTGLKQVFYLKTVETKTHVAFFVTNTSDYDDFSDALENYSVPDKMQTLLKGSYTRSGSEADKRKDGYGALKFIEQDGVLVDPAANKNENSEEVIDKEQHLEKLEKIVLFSKDDFTKPLQVTNFEYDYSLCQGATNAVDGSGKLTLKKVWFENEGVFKSRIAPYQFEYEYPKGYKEEIDNRYPAIKSFLDVLPAAEVYANPDYDPRLMDSWGFYQEHKEAKERADRLQDWVYQGYNENFDPAAWNLKVIKLPSGGEIHVQYEQKDYLYVQDKQAMGLVSLKGNSVDDYDSDNTKYYLNLSDFGMENATQEQLVLYALKLQSFYSSADGPKNFMFFNFLYDLVGESPSLDDKGSEYISGYATVARTGVDEHGIWIRLGDIQNSRRNGNSHRRVRKTVPAHICYDYFVSNADGLVRDDQGNVELNRFDQIEESIARLNNVPDDEIADVVNNPNRAFNSRHLHWDAARRAINQTFPHIHRFSPSQKSKCQSVNFGLSYLKIPLFNGKKGGGIRVKRLLMYDKGVETGDASIYGNEYRYELEDGRTSGVATNEPMDSREDHSLVTILDRTNQRWLNRVIAGPDKDQNEGPLGESLLPGPSIGHRRVVIENIHKGKTGTGRQVNEYHTCKDHPMLVKNTSLGDMHDEAKDARKNDWFVLPLPFLYYSGKKTWVAQGYSIIKNNMHGQPKAFSTYEVLDYSKIPVDAQLVASTRYEYYNSGEKIPVVSYDPTNKYLVKEMKSIGREEEITMEMRSTLEENFDLSLEIDLAFTWVPTFSIVPNLGFMLTNTLNCFSSHVTSKVVSYPVTVKAVEQTVNGITTREENIAFSEYTGDPLITKVTDGYHNLKLADPEIPVHNGNYYTYNFPAAWFYSEMGRISDNPDNLNQLSAMAGSVTAYGDQGDWFIDNIIDTKKRHNGVIAANAVHFKKDWYSNSDDIIKEYILNDKDPGNNGIVDNTDELDALKEKLNRFYMPKASFTYKADRNSRTDKKIYADGVINDFQFFDWHTEMAKDQQTGLVQSGDEKWLLANQVTRYSPNGMPIEEKNTIGIPSAVRFGYRGNMMPVVVSANAEYPSIWFQDFENEDLASILKFSHSGRKCLNIRSHPNYELINTSHGLKLNQQLMDQGAIMKIWVRSVNTVNPVNVNDLASPALNVNNNITVPLQRIGTSGEWALYEGKVSDWRGMALDQELSVRFVYDFSDNEEVHLDDFRFQPMDAEATCYVYDVRNLKLLTQFDDQHFGVYYQYNSEGKLVSQMVETERGMKTIKETQYNIPLTDRQ
ncbi:hypothetical protein RCC89_05030 [Cytophagaceae bacterium ABcell3]|nr:hypothetical protein RCC89_05030 [Cytophagaceae bacterium ABcell3]